MTRLNHPLKRLFFILFICSGTLLIGLALLPSPFEFIGHPEWKDTATSESPDRHVTRIDTRCAATQFGDLEDFTREFSIVLAYSSENKYHRIFTEMLMEGGESLGIAPTFDFTEQEKAAFFSKLSDTDKPCLKGVCVVKFDADLFNAILEKCGASVGQRWDDVRHLEWRITDNLANAFPSSLIAFLLSVAFILLSLLYDLLSLLYDRTLGPIVRWIRTGSW